MLEASAWPSSRTSHVSGLSSSHTDLHWAALLVALCTEHQAQGLAIEAQLNLFPGSAGACDTLREVKPQLVLPREK